MAYDKVLNDILERKQRAETGKYNCLPLPFTRFKSCFPGIERGKYLIISANQKIGKSKLADFLFVYEPVFFGISHPEFKFKTIYFSLEMSAIAKYYEFLSHLLFRLDNIVIAPTQLKSVENDHPVPQRIIDLLNSEKYQKYIKFYEEHVEYHTDSANPTGLRKVVRGYADTHGKYNYIPYKVINDVTGVEETRMRLNPDNPYTPNDPDEYVIVVTDNAANITTEKGMTQKESIEKWSKDLISFRDLLNYIPVLIQHQALYCTNNLMSYYIM